ncbi:Gfo/Idh/MocA family oxidoreductase [Sphingobacterium sp.]|uniref:Gfo/Idh/MocA family protein n=1 Tax=Sphingobacterium sp. TaxID=341027 RepID=UPI0028A6B24C|nr:Gfo/Idh/MocA family oxidoreductase [Sphingobacterium sp.]
MMDKSNKIKFNTPKKKPNIPIVIIGAGGIVQNGHLPAYRLAGFEVKGLFDVNFLKAKKVAKEFDIPKVYKSFNDLVDDNKNFPIYDIAVPGKNLISVLKNIPENSYVLMQKPMGENLNQAKEILAICKERKLVAGVNFQLRYAPFILMAKQMLEQKLIGEICDVEVYVNVYTPWELWGFLKDSPRLEILYHSIHYIDLIRNILGNPIGIFSKTIKVPKFKHLSEVKSTIIMDYGEEIRVNIITNHNHDFGSKNQDAFIKFEGTNGAIKIKLGLLMDYPQGQQDNFEYTILNENNKNVWRNVPINGSWFPHGFIGVMDNLMKVKLGYTTVLDNSVVDCYNTMVCVEAAYESVIPQIIGYHT